MDVILLWMEDELKGELQCKTTLGEVKEGQKIRVFPVLVFCVDPPFKGKKP